MRKAITLILCLSAPPASADGLETIYQIPSSINLSTKRAEMSEKLPKIGDETPRIRALNAYKRDHERFRVAVLEGLNEEIKSICDELKAVERQINRDLRNGNISQNKFEDLAYQIEEERRNCLFENRETSPYFKLYDEFTVLYQKSSAEADVMIAECYASDACSGRSKP